MKRALVVVSIAALAGGVFARKPASNDMPDAARPEIAAAIAKLGVGNISPLVNLDGWGFIVRKDAESPAKDLSFREAYDEIAANVKQELSAARYKEWVSRLRNEAFIKINPPPSDN